MQELLSLSKSSDGHSKILFSSREGIEISRVLRKKRYISLRDEKKDVDTDIELFTRQSLSELRERFTNKEMNNVEKTIVNKANGEVFSSFSHIYNGLKNHQECFYGYGW